MAAGRQEDLRGLVESSYRPARICAEHAAEDRRTGQESTCHGRRHWQRPVAVPGLIYRRRHPDGIRRTRRARQPGDFRSGRRPARGEALAKLSTATIRAVALGVIGVAFIQAILIGLALLLAGVPAAGVLAIIVLVLGIAQLPAVIVTIPAIIYIWSSGDYSTAAAITHTIILLLAGMADNVLKPLMLGRGVDVPMPVILLGALGGMASGGILGMFVGATLFALGYESSWVGLPTTRTVIRYHTTNRSNTAIRDQRFKSLCDVRDSFGEIGTNGIHLRACA